MNSVLQYVHYKGWVLKINVIKKDDIECCFNIIKIMINTSNARLKLIIYINFQY